jgi:uncharacterized protein (DUF2236 family)
MEVGRRELEAALEGLTREVRDPAAGLFGPGTATWDISREAVIFLGAGRAALLQLAHPWVAQAIAHHSETRVDPHHRFVRTFTNVFDMVFGDLPAALAAARRVHRVHESIRGQLDEATGAFPAGSSYLANEPEALFWVHATIMVYEMVVRPLRPEERAAYYRESVRFTRLFAIPERVIPPTWDAFMAYNRRMWASDTVTVSGAAREVAHHILHLGHPALAPVSAWFRAVTAALLPERLRAGFGLRCGLPERAALTATARGLHLATRLLPERLRYLPAYVEAQGRVAGRKPSGLVDRLVQQALSHAGRWVLTSG